MANKTKKPARLFKLGCCYQVDLNDHALGNMGVVPCRTVGWAMQEDDISVTLSYWIPITNDISVRDPNMELVHIVKSAIIKKKKLS